LTSHAAPLQPFPRTHSGLPAAAMRAANPAEHHAESYYLSEWWDE
jgi:hypothetical protein